MECLMRFQRNIALGFKMCMILLTVTAESSVIFGIFFTLPHTHTPRTSKYSENKHRMFYSSTGI